MYQKIYKKTKDIIKDAVCLKLYNEKESLYLETDFSGIGLGAGLLQVRDGMQFSQEEAPDNTALCLIALASMILTSAKTWYSNMDREALGIFSGLEKFHHYCFTNKVSTIMEHEPKVAMF